MKIKLNNSSVGDDLLFCSHLTLMTCDDLCFDLRQQKAFTRTKIEPINNQRSTNF